SPKDKQNGVLRDSNGTSFHLNAYENGKEATESLARITEQMVTTLQRLAPDQRLEFAKSMEWDKTKGCLEASLGPAFDYARLQLDAPTLDSIMAGYIKGDEIPRIAFILGDLAKKSITHADWNGEKNCELNKDLIARYLKEI